MTDRRFAEGEDLQSRARRDNKKPEQAPETIQEPGGGFGRASTPPVAPVSDMTGTTGMTRTAEVERTAGKGSGTARAEGFLPGHATEKLRERWRGIQFDFVDDPRHAVEQADILLEQVTVQLAESIATRRRTLRSQWSNEGTGSAADCSGSPTEQLRTQLLEYRQLLNRLLET